jgi:hypothetical protein
MRLMPMHREKVAEKNVTVCALLVLQGASLAECPSFGELLAGKPSS